MTVRPTEEIKLEIGRVLKIWHLYPDGTLIPTVRGVSIGRAVETYDDHLMVDLGREVGTYAFYYDRIEGYEAMPDPGQFSSIMATARLHYDSASDSWEEGDHDDWCIGACVQDVRKLLEILEVTEAMRDNGVF